MLLILHFPDYFTYYHDGTLTILGNIDVLVSKDLLHCEPLMKRRNGYQDQNTP